VGTTQAAPLSLETMGAGGLPGTAQARGIGARSVEHQQIGPWSMAAAVEDTGTDDRVTIALVHEPGTTQSCATVGIHFSEPPDTCSVRPVVWCGREEPRGFFLSRFGPFLSIGQQGAL
jgi:hypothetical protein